MLVSCRGGSSVDPEQFDYRTGSSALKMTFDDNLPPEEVYTQTTVPFSLLIANEGAELLRGGIITVITDDKLVSLTQGLSMDGNLISSESPNKATFDLEGRSVRNPIGGKSYLTTTLEIKDIGPQREELKSQMTVQSCYPYRTFMRRSVCLDTDVYKQVQLDKACEMKDISAGTQGAPLAVSKIEVKTAPHKTNNRKKVPAFVFEIQNIGDGQVTAPYSYREACSSSGSPNFNEVRLIARMPGEQGSERLMCTPSVSDQAKDVGVIRLKDGKGSIRCSLEEGVDADRGAYTVLLEVELDYGYTQTISREITLKKGI